MLKDAYQFPMVGSSDITGGAVGKAASISALSVGLTVAMMDVA